MKIKRLDWDSCFLDLEVGRLSLREGFDRSTVEHCLTGSLFDLVYIFLNQPTDEEVREIERVAPLYDRKIKFRKLISPSALSLDHRIVPHQGGVQTDLVELVLMSGVHSRFNLDPKLQPCFERFYTEWLSQSLAGTMADSVCVARAGEKLSGFITLRKMEGKIGQIGLIAAHPDCRGKGVGMALLAYADTWFLQEGCVEAEVVTQRENLPACRLYEKTGYTQYSEAAVFHWWR